MVARLRPTIADLLKCRLGFGDKVKYHFMFDEYLLILPNQLEPEARALTTPVGHELDGQTRRLGLVFDNGGVGPTQPDLVVLLDRVQEEVILVLAAAAVLDGEVLQRHLDQSCRRLDSPPAVLVLGILAWIIRRLQVVSVGCGDLVGVQQDVHGTVTTIADGGGSGSSSGSGGGCGCGSW